MDSLRRRTRRRGSVRARASTPHQGADFVIGRIERPHVGRRSDLDKRNNQTQESLMFGISGSPAPKRADLDMVWPAS
jgi:hypothetical protein